MNDEREVVAFILLRTRPRRVHRMVCDSGPVFSHLKVNHMISTCLKMATIQDTSNSKMTVLHISDVHSEFDMVEKLRQWIVDNHVRIDLTLFSGDMATMPMDHSLPREEVERYSEDFRKIIEVTSSLCPCMLYIPGNHDPMKFFNPPEEKVTISARDAPATNIHNRVVRIRPDLCVVGFGGSIPVYKDGEVYWLGYPHTTVESYTEEIKKLLTSVFTSGDSPLKADDSVILMIHNGPDDSSTSVDLHLPSVTVNSGVPYVGQFLKSTEAQNKIFATLHGHTHMCAGKMQIGSITVSNPGSLKEGRFAVYHLERGRVHPLYEDSYKGQWALTSTSYHTLI